jgi:hypothetical protein
MKKISLLAICAVFALMVNAQSNIDELKYLQGMFGIEKKQLVKEQMNISKTDSLKFWTLYEEYELYRSEISDKRAENIQLFAKNLSSMSNDAAKDIMQHTFDINLETDKLLQKTYKSMSKELNPKLAAKFIYGEMYFEAIGRQRLVELIPDIKKAEQLKK